MKPLPASPKGRRQSKGGRHSNKGTEDSNKGRERQGMGFKRHSNRITKIVTKEGKDIIWVLKTQ